MQGSPRSVPKAIAGSYDTIVIGGGLVGSAVAWGAARLGARVALVDEGDVAYRASRGNFGQVWIQGKGEGRPAYARLTRRSARLWSGFAQELESRTGIAVGFRQPGGYTLCLSEDEFAERARVIERTDRESGSIGMRMMDRDELREAIPLQIGPQVTGASYCPLDAHVSPLYLLRALHADIQAMGGAFMPSITVSDVAAEGSGFVVRTPQGALRGGRIVVAAGLGSEPLAARLGLWMPVTPLKGQVIVTERVAKFPDLLTTGVRQTEEGSIMLGGTREDIGYDVRSTLDGMRSIAARCLIMFPALARLRIVRTWGALRVMTPDGFPIYEQSARHPGAFAVTCHSGVTLAAVHALEIAASIMAGGFDADLAEMTSERFHVSAA